MSIIITEEDLCKKHAKKCAKICQFSSLPSKCFQAVNDPNTKNDFKPHISAYSYNTRTGFRDHKKILGSRVLSSTLLVRLGWKLQSYTPLALVSTVVSTEDSTSQHCMQIAIFSRPCYDDCTASSTFQWKLSLQYSSTVVRNCHSVC